jgi:hypothetical protein
LGLAHRLEEESTILVTDTFCVLTSVTCTLTSLRQENWICSITNVTFKFYWPSHHVDEDIEDEVCVIN